MANRQPGLQPNPASCRVFFTMRIANANPKPDESIPVTIQMPKGIAPKFGADPEAIGRRVIEQAAAEGYRYRDYDREDLEEDRRNLHRILGPS